MDDAQIKNRVIGLVRNIVPESANSDQKFVQLGEEGGFDSVLALELLLALETESESS